MIHTHFQMCVNGNWKPLQKQRSCLTIKISHKNAQPIKVAIILIVNEYTHTHTRIHFRVLIYLHKIQLEKNTYVVKKLSPSYIHMHAFKTLILWRCWCILVDFAHPKTLFESVNDLQNKVDGFDRSVVSCGKIRVSSAQQWRKICNRQTLHAAKRLVLITRILIRRYSKWIMQFYLMHINIINYVEHVHVTCAHFQLEAVWYSFHYIQLMCASISNTVDKLRSIVCIWSLLMSIWSPSFSCITMSIHFHSTFNTNSPLRVWSSPRRRPASPIGTLK